MAVKRRKKSFLNKFLSRLDRVGPEEIQQQLERLVKESGFLETIFNTLQEGVLVLHEDGEIIYLNNGVERLLGIGAEAVGRPVSEYIREINWARMLQEGRVLSRDLEVFYPEERLLNFYLVPTEEATGTYVVIFHDITAVREKTRERIESEKLNALTLLAAGVAHELGNPLNSLHIQFQLMERDLEDMEGERAERLGESVKVAQREIGRLDTIIRQFLAAVRPGQPERGRCQVNNLLLESVSFLDPELKDRDILVETELADNLPPLALDATQIKQAFYNLIKNAVQAMSPGGILRLSTERNDTHLVVSFADNGSGITVETVSRVFDPYFTTKTRGSGLGLFVVRRIVQEHGGELMIESEPGRGTTARILLPLAERRVRLLEDQPRLALADRPAKRAKR